jgi:4'-phosphopantetheinyl transferase
MTGCRQDQHEIEVHLVDLVEAAPFLEAEEERTPRLSSADVERAATIADIEARRLWRASRIATRIALERSGGAHLRGVAFEHEPAGRPFLRGGGPQFSVSHTDGRALIAVSTGRRVGVDLERADRVLKMSSDRRRRIFEASRRLGHSQSIGTAADVDVLTAWVQLEAIAKALGIGIGRLLTQEGVIGRAEPTCPGPAMRGLSVQLLHLGAEYVGAIAGCERFPIMEVRPFPYARLTEFLEGY